MAKRKAESQIGSLTPDHYKSRIDLISLCVGGVRHTIGKLSMKVTSYKFASKHSSFQSKVCTQSYGAPKLQESQLWEFSGLPFGSSGTKCHLDVGLVERHKVYYKGEGGGFPQVWVVVNLVSSSLFVVRPSTKNARTMH